MTIFRFRAAVLGLAALLEPSYSEPNTARALPKTSIGRIMRLGDVKRINAELKRHLLALPDQQAREKDLAKSGFSGGSTYDGCQVWYFAEPEDKAIRDSWLGLGYYTLYVSIDLCRDGIKVSAGYRGL